MKLLFSTRNYVYLYDELLKIGLYEAGSIETKVFPDGECYKRLLTEVDGREVILVGGTINDIDTLEVYDLACSIVKQGAASLTLVVPYYAYSTMERAVKKGEVVTAKTRARLLSSIPNTGKGNHIIFCDLHSEGIPHYFEGNIRPIHLYCKPLIIEACYELAGGNDFILACTDAGRAKWVESLANDMHVNAAFVFKKRLSGEETSITGINADVKDKKVIIYDDMIRTGGSLLQAAKSYKEAGAKEVFAITTHGLFSNNALEKLKKSELFSKIIATNTHPNVLELKGDFLAIKSIASLINTKIKEKF
jgi:ribose-phosphate pyrophosphokinase